MNAPTGLGLLSLVIWLPLIGALLLLLIPESKPKAIKAAGLAIGVLTFVASLGLLVQFDPSKFTFQLQEFEPWLTSLGINYQIGVDGISIWLVILTTFLTIFALGYSVYVDKRIRLYMALLLMLETAMLGAFLSLDLILFYTFFELSLVPMYFLIAVWGGENRSKAAAKFFVYTFAGSIFMLVGMVTIAFLNKRATGVWTFSLVDIQAAAANGSLWATAMQAQTLVFWTFAIAFLVKAPCFPFHTWLPDTYAESPIAGPILSSVMVKMGTYGLLRFCIPLFPDALKTQIPILMGLAVFGIIYGAIVATVQTDIRRLLAFSTISHMGFILLGIFSLNTIGAVGGAYQQLNHAITASALFLLAGFLIQRRGTGELKEFGGLKARMPIFATLFLISMLASVGLPGLNGFVGEFLALMGAFQSGFIHAYGLSELFVVVAAMGVILAAGYLLYLFQQLFYGPITVPINRRLLDLKPWEACMVSVLVALMIWGGIYPSTFTKPMEASVQAMVGMANPDPSQRPVWNSPAPPGVTAAVSAPSRGQG